MGLKYYAGFKEPVRQCSFNSQLCQCNYICADLTTEPRSGDGEGNEREERGKGVGVEKRKEREEGRKTCVGVLWQVFEDAESR